MHHPPIVRITTPRDLIASLPALCAPYCTAIDERGLLLLRITPAERGWSRVTAVIACELNWFDDIYGLAASSSTAEGDRVIAIVIDRDADGAGDNGFEHTHYLRDADHVLRGYGIRLDAAYATRAARPGHPVWSLDDDGYHGQVPDAPAAPPEAIYLIATPVTARPLPIVAAR